MTRLLLNLLQVPGLLRLFAERTSWLVAAVRSSACFSALHAFNPEYYWLGFAYAFLLVLRALPQRAAIESRNS